MRARRQKSPLQDTERTSAPCTDIVLPMTGIIFPLYTYACPPAEERPPEYQNYRMPHTAARTAQKIKKAKSPNVGLDFSCRVRVSRWRRRLQILHEAAMTVPSRDNHDYGMNTGIDSPIF